MCLSNCVDAQAGPHLGLIFGYDKHWFTQRLARLYQWSVDFGPFIIN